MGFAQLLDEVADFDNLNRVESDGRLVQNDDLRIAQKRLCNPNTLSVTFGECANESVTHLLNARTLHCAVNFPAQLLSPQSLCLPNKSQIFLRCFIGIERRLLWEISDQPFGLFGLLQNIKAADFDNAVRRVCNPSRQRADSCSHVF